MPGCCCGIMVGVAGVMGLAGGVPPTLATAEGADGTKGFAVGFRVNSLAFGFSLLLEATALLALLGGDAVVPPVVVDDPVAAAGVAAFSPATSVVAAAADTGGSAAEASGIFFSCC